VCHHKSPTPRDKRLLRAHKKRQFHISGCTFTLDPFIQSAPEALLFSANLQRWITKLSRTSANAYVAIWSCGRSLAEEQAAELCSFPGQTSFRLNRTTCWTTSAAYSETIIATLLRDSTCLALPIAICNRRSWICLNNHRRQRNQLSYTTMELSLPRETLGFRKFSINIAVTKAYCRSSK
jgi:hypothetical protein